MECIQMLPLASVPKKYPFSGFRLPFGGAWGGLPCLSNLSLGHRTLRKAVPLVWLGLEWFVSHVPGPWAALRDKISYFCGGEGASGDRTFPLP